MNKADKKKFVFDTLNKLLKPQGYYLVKTGLDPTYVLKKQDKIISFFFNFKDYGGIEMSNLYLSILMVENIIFEIKKPNQDYSYIDNKKYFLSTVYDKNEIFDRKINVIETNEELELLTNRIVQYLETNGKAFIEKYSYLPNVLEEMDKLEKQGLNWNHKDKGILSGSLDAYFRGLIISKFCNDTNFDKKIEKMNAKFNEIGYEEWLPFYEKLKERLKTIEPIYNV
jgi:hypothetical protein